MSGQLFDVKQVEKKLMLSERTIFRLIKSGDLKGFKVGREWRFEESDIDAYIQAQKAKTWREATIPATEEEAETETWWQKPEQKG
jgi:excisionase family DNA binding protein